MPAYGFEDRLESLARRLHEAAETHLTLDQALSRLASAFRTPQEVAPMPTVRPTRRPWRVVATDGHTIYSFTAPEFRVDAPASFDSFPANSFSAANQFMFSGQSSDWQLRVIDPDEADEVGTAMDWLDRATREGTAIPDRLTHDDPPLRQTSTPIRVRAPLSEYTGYAYAMPAANSPAAAAIGLYNADAEHLVDWYVEDESVPLLALPGPRDVIILDDDVPARDTVVIPYYLNADERDRALLIGTRRPTPDPTEETTVEMRGPVTAAMAAGLPTAFAVPYGDDDRYFQIWSDGNLLAGWWAERRIRPSDTHIHIASTADPYGVCTAGGWTVPIFRNVDHPEQVRRERTDPPAAPTAEVPVGRYAEGHHGTGTNSTWWTELDEDGDWVAHVTMSPPVRDALDAAGQLRAEVEDFGSGHGWELRIRDSDGRNRVTRISPTRPFPDGVDHFYLQDRDGLWDVALEQTVPW